MRNTSLGGSDCCYDPDTGGGQMGITGGTGPNNIAMLVRVFGRITGMEPVQAPASPTWLTLDDGSGCEVRCVFPSTLAIDPTWTNLVVTGVVSCRREQIGGLPCQLPQILVRSASTL